MEDDIDIVSRAEAYALKRGCRLEDRLGSGIHGIVFAAVGNGHPGVAALKVHYDREPYLREKSVYLRLRGAQVYEVRATLAFQVPQLISFDDELLALEMSVVRPPFVLDFAGADLDQPPEFTDEIWEEWRRKNEEQFGDNWEIAQTVLYALQRHGVYMFDPSPANIRFV